MFSWLYNLLGSMLSWFSSITGSYAVALIFYALIFKILFLPFSIKQQKNQIKMAELRPKIALIEKKYAGRNDQPTLQKKQQEILELQQKEGYNPLSGCLPLLLQFPIIIFLYNVIRSPLSYICKLENGVVEAINKLVTGTETAFGSINQIGLVGSINSYIAENGSEKIIEAGLDPSRIPNFTLFGIDLSATPTFTPISWLVVIPVLAAAASWLSMFLTRKWSGAAQQTAGQDAQTAASMRMMDITMPLLTLWMAFSFSGMLGLYWVYQSILGIIQSFILSKAMPLPTYTEEQLKEMQKAEKARQKAERSALKQQPKYKSLHYIDDDDYDELPEIEKPKEKTTETKPNGIEVSLPKDDKKN